jgi:radical SAM protein with 4Fe4S-binding SPASM domain
MEALSYSDLSLHLHQGAVENRLPINGTIEVTRRCPLTCAHCYNNLPMSDQGARLSELTYDEHCRILDEITEAGCLWLLYTGGEIFARKDFLDIYTYAKRKGLIVTLFTNGTMITPKIADYLVQWPPFAVEITLYGRTKETYERLTGIPGSYEKCMRGINLLMERGLPLKLKTVGVTINKHEIWEMKRFAQQKLGLEFKFDSMINPRIDCSQSPLAVRLTPEEIVTLDLQDPKVVAEWRKFAERTYGPVNPPEHSDEVYHCGGGITSFAIDPQGRMSICVLSHVDKYDLRKGSFREAWEEFLLKVRRKKITRPTKCAACAIKAMCGMCPANGELENGDPESPVDFLCQTAHLRAHAFGVDITPHGECEYCEGGTRYEKLMASVASLHSVGKSSSYYSDLTSNNSPLPIAESTGCGSGGCSSCSLAASRA